MPDSLAAQTWDAHYGAPSGFRYWPSEELVRSMARRRPTAAILDVGCGNGSNLDLLYGYVSSLLVGIDASPIALAAARARYPDNGCGYDRLVIERAEIADGSLAFPVATFGGLVDCMTSQHVPLAAHEALYRDYARVLEPGGWFFLLHLDDATRTARTPPMATDCERVGLFPEAGFACLPHPLWLVCAVERAGFRIIERRGLAREYADGSIAHYTIIDAEVACA